MTYDNERRDKDNSWFDLYLFEDAETQKALQARGKYGWQDCEIPSWIRDEITLGEHDGELWYGDSWIYKTYIDYKPRENGGHYDIEDYECKKQLRYRDWPEHVKEDVTVNNERR